MLRHAQKRTVQLKSSQLDTSWRKKQIINYFAFDATQSEFVYNIFHSRFGSGRCEITYLAPPVEKKIHSRPWIQLSEPERLLCQLNSLRTRSASEFCFDVRLKDANNIIKLRCALFCIINKLVSDLSQLCRKCSAHLWDFRTSGVCVFTSATRYSVC